MEKDKLPQQFNGEDDLEEEISSVEDEIEKESKEEEEPEPVVNKKQITKQSSEEINETYEVFDIPARVGIINTLTGEPIIEGFDREKDKVHILAYKVILNQLSKIAVASGA